MSPGNVATNENVKSLFLTFSNVPLLLSNLNAWLMFNWSISAPANKPYGGPTDADDATLTLTHEADKK